MLSMRVIDRKVAERVFGKTGAVSGVSVWTQLKKFESGDSLGLTSEVVDLLYSLLLLLWPKPGPSGCPSLRTLCWSAQLSLVFTAPRFCRFMFQDWILLTRQTSKNAMMPP